MNADTATCDRWYTLRNHLQGATLETGQYLTGLNPTMRPEVDTRNVELRDDLMEMYPVATQGQNGLSAFEVAQTQGYTGTVTQWLASLVGRQGDPGTPGTPGTNGTNGANGISPQRARLPTAADGTLTWTFPVPYAAGVRPIITALVEDSTAGAVAQVSITALSNTSVSFKVVRSNDLVILTSVHVLGLLANAVVYLHVQASPP